MKVLCGAKKSTCLQICLRRFEKSPAALQKFACGAFKKRNGEIYGHDREVSEEIQSFGIRKLIFQTK